MLNIINMSIEQKNGMTVQKVEDAKSLPVCFDVVLWPFIHFHFTKIKIDNETIFFIHIILTLFCRILSDDWEQLD